MKTVLATLLGVAFYLCLFSAPVLAQAIDGRVMSGTDPISGAVIRIEALHRTAQSNEKGVFRFENVPLGTYTLVVRRVGFKSRSVDVQLDAAFRHVDIALEVSVLESAPISVTAEPQPAPLMESPISTTVLEGAELDIQRSQSIGETISQLPGINSFGSGALSTKPVVRGLMGPRVLIAQNGSRVESQSWDEPQSPEVDPLDVERIEIVRGPNSVMFGSDAVGGVVNVVRHDVFAHAPTSLGANLMLSGFSNNESGSGALSLFGNTGDFAYRINASGRIAGDYSTPAGSVQMWSPDTTGGLHFVEKTRTLASGSVFNSGAEEFNGAATLGWRQSWGTLIFDYTHFGRKLFIHPEPGRKEVELNINTMKMDTLDASPVQEVMHEKATLSANLPMDNMRLEIIGGFQYDKRREEGVRESEEVELKKEQLGIPPEVQLDLYTISLDARLHFSDFGTVGVSYANQRNQSLGMKDLIPEYHANILGAFAYAEKKFYDALRVTGALRFDTKSMLVDERRTRDSSRTLLNPIDTVAFEVIMAQLGAAWTINPHLVLSCNIGPGWRAPVAAELYSFGRDEGDIQYKVGNNKLKPEVSQNVDVALRYADNSVRAELNLYRNHINDFIYATPTGRIIESVLEYQYTQANATMLGFEASLQYVLSSSFVVGLGADLVRGTFDSTETFLPRVPAARLLVNLGYLHPELMGIRNVRINLNPRFSMAQDRTSSLEIATPSYFILGVSLAGDVSISNYNVHCVINVDNATNAAYVDYLSRLKQLALNPGLNVALKMSMPFNIL